MAEKTSLQKSHSKVSNFKLTMICFILAFAISAVWIGLALLNTNVALGASIAGVGGVVAVLFFILIGKFTR